jgi:hypothetical protein
MCSLVCSDTVCLLSVPAMVPCAGEHTLWLRSGVRHHRNPVWQHHGRLCKPRKVRTRLRHHLVKCQFARVLHAGVFVLRQHLLGAKAPGMSLYATGCGSTNLQGAAHRHHLSATGFQCLLLTVSVVVHMFQAMPPQTTMLQTRCQMFPPVCAGRHW